MTKKKLLPAENASRANLLILHNPASITLTLAIFNSFGAANVAYVQFGTSVFFTTLNYLTTRAVIDRFAKETFLYVIIYIANPLGGLIAAPGLSLADRKLLMKRIGMEQYA